MFFSLNADSAFSQILQSKGFCKTDILAVYKWKINKFYLKKAETLSAPLETLFRFKCAWL